MFFLEIKENQTMWLCLTGSLLIHGWILFFSGTTFIPQARFGVQPSVQTVEVSLEDFHDTQLLPQGKYLSKGPIASTSVDRKLVHSRSGVKLKANLDYFQNPPPEYPDLAKQMRQEGMVMLSVDVDQTGGPVKVEIIKSSGYLMLDQAALRAVSHWKFQPGSIGNTPVESTVTVPIRFRLEK